MADPIATDDRVDPQMAADERTTLTEFLDYFRGTLELKVAGIDDCQARTEACPPSTLTLMGLVRHLADVERYWFRRVLLDDEAPPLFFDDEHPDGDLEPGPDDTLSVALTAWRAEVDHARVATAGHELDDLSALARHGEHPNLRWILVHMIEEYARHCGHADLIRQAVDGQVGD